MQFLEAILEVKEMRISDFKLLSKELIDKVLSSNVLVWMKFDKCRGQLKERSSSKIGGIAQGQFREIAKYLI